jgi:integrase
MPKITVGLEKSVEIPVGRSDVMVFDDTLQGFYLRVSKTGRATFGVDYYALGKRRRLSLGPAGSAAALTAARREAEKVLAGAKLGRDAVQQRAEAKAASAENFGRLARKFLDDQESQLRPKTYIEWTRYLTQYLNPLNSRAVGSIDRRDINAELDRIASAHSPIAADRARTAASAFFAWCIKAGYLDANPVVGAPRKSKPRSRCRVLDDAELAEVWHAAGEGDYADILRLLILTGARREEIASLAWPEIDLNRCILTLPPERTKNGRQHVMPLSPQAVAILQARAVWESRAFIFGLGEGGFSGWSRCKVRLDGRIRRARQEAGRTPMPAWTIHDLRRSVASGLAQLGVALPVIERILNHVSGPSFGGVAGVYQRHSFEKEMRAAMKLWGEHVANLSS